MLTELCKELNNWFDHDRFFGTFSIENGSIDLSETGIQNGQHFRICGSVFNDGVYKYPTNNLEDETFDGAIWAMAVPQRVSALDNEIEAWKAKYGGPDSAAMSPFQSESFGGYSYSKSGSASSDGYQPITWQDVFRSQLNQWRKIR